MKYFKILSGCILDGKAVEAGALIDPATLESADMQILITAQLGCFVEVEAPKEPAKKRGRK